MIVERYLSAQRFLDEAGPWLAVDEAANNLIFALAQSLAGNDHPFHEPIYLAAVKERGQIVGCAVRPPPDHLDLTPMPPGAAALIAADAVAHCPDLEAIGGQAAAASEFAAAWVRLRGGQWRIAHNWSWLVLREVCAPQRSPGALRLAEQEDWGLISAWAPLYMRDTGAAGSVQRFLERRLRTRSLFVWDDDGPKCMASISGFTPNGARISAVFTPEEQRRKGYASNTVAALSAQALAGGRNHCVLFAESHHEATVRVYENIGYRHLHGTVLVELGIA
ncbi:MAG TPA: GNAT family N-acetyltransferase [Gammaproteobacteria bacterium]|nr:GNAT family N-acetyltransferase [Gammaproteobacteria bacterium]